MLNRAIATTSVTSKVPQNTTKEKESFLFFFSRVDDGLEEGVADGDLAGALAVFLEVSLVLTGLCREPVETFVGTRAPSNVVDVNPPFHVLKEQSKSH